VQVESDILPALDQKEVGYRLEQQCRLGDRCRLGEHCRLDQQLSYILFRSFGGFGKRTKYLAGPSALSTFASRSLIHPVGTYIISEDTSIEGAIFSL
jgi:hypothetical protein